MARRVYKFPLQIVGVQTVFDVPLGSELLSVQLQNGLPVLYVAVDPGEVKRTPVTICCHGTGHSMMPEARKYLGTTMMRGELEGLVFHWFADVD